jgi:hypothetical protein
MINRSEALARRAFLHSVLDVDIAHILNVFAQPVKNKPAFPAMIDRFLGSRPIPLGNPTTQTGVLP